MKNPEGINFPIYRCYRNGRHFFKIMSYTEFEEIQIIGSRRIFKKIVAKHLPERNFVRDLIFKVPEMAINIDKAEYKEQLP